jgi:hypothetical protein
MGRGRLRSSKCVALVRTCDTPRSIRNRAALTKCPERGSPAEGGILGQKKVQDGPWAQVGQVFEHFGQTRNNLTIGSDLGCWIAPVACHLDA